MLLIPTLDIKNNFLVRLKKGNVKDKFIISNNPILILKKLINYNIKRLHLIDLDGAINGKPKNFFIIKSIIKYLNGKISVQIGGGFRLLETIKYYLELGINYIIVSTKAIMDLDFLNQICYKFENKIILSIDFNNKNLLINGWNTFLNTNLNELYNIINNYNINSVICTDINKDGMLNGININLLYNLSKKINKPIISSGGLYCLNDLKILFNLQKYNLLGLICGKSIYNGNLNIFNLQEKINKLNKMFIKFN